MFIGGISGIIPGTNSVAVGAPDGTDPHWENTVLLLSGNGVNGSQIFADESFVARGNGTVAGGGNNAQVQTSFKKFGSGSIRFDGTVDQITFGDSADWAFGSGAVTIETWASFAAARLSSDQVIMSHWTTTSSQRSWDFSYLGSTGQLAIALSSGGGSTTLGITGAFTPVADTFYHLVYDRSGNVHRLYVDGVMVGTATNALSLHDSTTSLRIGCVSSGGTDANLLHGNLDELRITKGVARYASDGGFSVPTAAFPRS